MAPLNAPGRQILEVLRTKLIPWAGGGAPFILLDAPPKLIGSNTVTEEPGHKLPLQRGIGQIIRTQAWREEGLNSVTTPYMGCVVDGEADIVTGTTTAMCRKLKIPGKRWIVRVPQQSFLMAPPHVPHSSGQRPHWERPHPETAYSRILWMQFHSTGIHCHFCTSDKGGHRTHPMYFINGTKFFPLAESLISEMSQQSPQYLPLVYLHLSTLLQLMVRNLLTKQAKNITEESMIIPSNTFSNADVLIQQAIDFIDQNLYDYPLSVERIAAHLHLSPRHLARIFQREAHISLMQLVTKRRMETACQLLIESQLNITGVAGHCGYASIPSFIKAFRRYSGTSPSAYRAAHKQDVSIR